MTRTRPIPVETRSDGIDLTRLPLDRFLAYYHISWRVETKAALNISCPFCDDTGKHLGIFTLYKNFNCWRCGETGVFIWLCSRLGISYEQVAAFAPRTRTGEVTDEVRRIFEDKTDVDRLDLKTVDLPNSYSVTNDICDRYPILGRWLDSRDIDIAVCQEYGARFCPYGRYANRLVIPVIFRGNVVGYQARAVVDNAYAKYLTSDDTPFSEVLYGFDFTKEYKFRSLFVVEGILDAWRIGTNALAVFKHVISPRQRLLLLELDPEELIIAFDGDAYNAGLESGRFLRAVLEYIKVLRLPHGADPDSFDPDQFRVLVSNTDYL